jgi:hypothetical protein
MPSLVAQDWVTEPSTVAFSIAQPTCVHMVLAFVLVFVTDRSTTSLENGIVSGVKITLPWDQRLGRGW